MRKREETARMSSSRCHLIGGMWEERCQEEGGVAHIVEEEGGTERSDRDSHVRGGLVEMTDSLRGEERVPQ